MEVKFIYAGIRVKNLEKSIRFYTKLLKMKAAGRQKIAETKGEVVSLVSEDGGFSLELNYYRKGSPYDERYAVGEGLDHLAFQVKSMDSLLAEAKKMGHPVVEEIRAKTSRWTYIEDPNGIWIELYR